MTPVLYPSPIHSYSKEATLRGYAKLLLQWEKREAEAEQVLRQADLVRGEMYMYCMWALAVGCAAALFLLYVRVVLQINPAPCTPQTAMERL